MHAIEKISILKCYYELEDDFEEFKYDKCMYDKYIYDKCMYENKINAYDDFYIEGLDNIKYDKPCEELYIIIHKFLALKDKMNNSSLLKEKLLCEYNMLMLLAIKFSKVNKYDDQKKLEKYNLLAAALFYFYDYDYNNQDLDIFDKHIYKIVKYTNITIFNHFMLLYNEGIINKKNLNINKLLKNAGKNVDCSVNDYVKFIFKDCNNIYPVNSITNIFYKNRKFTKEMIEIIKYKCSIYKNNFILINWCNKFNEINTYFELNFFKYLNTDIKNIIKSYIIDYDLEYHYPINKKISCDDFMIKFESDTFKRLNSHIIEYENYKICMPNFEEVCPCCYIKYLEKII